MAHKITCQICGAESHAINIHLKEEHPDWDVERYKAEFPGAPLLSEYAKESLRKSVPPPALALLPLKRPLLLLP